MTLVHVGSASEADDVRLARAGDREAFGRLVERHWARLARLARSVLGPAEAEDAAQEALVDAWQALGSLREAGSFRPWLTRIVLRRSLRRSRWNRLRATLTAWRDPGERPDPESELSLWCLLRRLAPRQRAVLHLTVVEELSDSEIGQLLSLRPASVRAHRRRAREALARLLGDKP